MKKVWWKSRTVQGILIVFVSIMLRLAAAKGWLSGLLVETTTEYLKELCEMLGLGGLGYALYGRAKTNGEKLSSGFSKDD